MTTQPVYPVQAYFRRGLSLIYFLPAIAAPEDGPTSTELTAGINLSPAVAAIAGFTFANSPIPVPNLSAVFTGQIPGEDTADSSSLTFNDDKVDDVIRTALAKGASGFIALMPKGPGAGKPVQDWPVTSTGFNDQWDLGNTPAQAVCQFAITSPPYLDAVQA